MTIDPQRLEDLAMDLSTTVASICGVLGISEPTFYKALKDDPTLRKRYDAARAEARRVRDADRPPSQRATPPKKKTRKPSASAKSNGRATPAFDQQFIKQLNVEFAHIDAWGEVSEHFDELRERVAAL